MVAEVSFSQTHDPGFTDDDVSREFHQVHGYPAYEVNRLGQIRTIKTGYLKKVFYNTKRYPTVYLQTERGRGRPVMVAQVVMHTFARQIMPKRYIIRYKDGDKNNFRFENLYYGSMSEMVSQAHKEGHYLNRKGSFLFPCGPANPKYVHGRGQLSPKERLEYYGPKPQA